MRAAIVDSILQIRIVEARQLAIPEIAAVMREGSQWLPESSDYWFFATFCGSTSFIALNNETAVGGLIACRNPEKLDEIYIDQVAVHRQFRGQGIVQALLRAIETRARELHCTRMWLSADPKNPAVKVWARLGFVNCLGDTMDGDLSINRDFKGPGKHRAIFEKVL
jgi:ribosomal protein S18 acetylase RimI-like enzyme